MGLGQCRFFELCYCVTIFDSFLHTLKYAAAIEADLARLLRDRARPALTQFFATQVKQRPRLSEEHFFDEVKRARDVDVLLIT